MELSHRAPELLSQLQTWQLMALVGAFAGAGALLKVLIEAARAKPWRQALRVLSSAFWGAMAAVLVSDWLTLSPKSLLVLATLLGWVGHETTLRNLSRLVGKKTDLKLETPPKPARRKPRGKRPAGSPQAK